MNLSLCFRAELPAVAEEAAGESVVLALTASEEGPHVFNCTEVRERVQKVQRFSIQRTFVELYDYSRPQPCSGSLVPLAAVSAGMFLERGVPAADFAVLPALRRISRGRASMAERTGTLWENDTSSASCNHGFASHVVVWLS